MRKPRAVDSNRSVFREDQIVSISLSTWTQSGHASLGLIFHPVLSSHLRYLPRCVVREMVQIETARDGRRWLIPFRLSGVEGRVAGIKVPWTFLAFPLFPHSIQLDNSGAGGAEGGAGIWRLEMA